MRWSVLTDPIARPVPGGGSRLCRVGAGRPAERVSEAYSPLCPNDPGFHQTMQAFVDAAGRVPFGGQAVYFVTRTAVAQNQTSPTRPGSVRAPVGRECCRPNTFSAVAPAPFHFTVSSNGCLAAYGRRRRQRLTVFHLTDIATARRWPSRDPHRLLGSGCRTSVLRLHPFRQAGRADVTNRRLPGPALRYTGSGRSGAASWS